ncbi:MAG: peptide chain release factor N(5)-glutamine methyltransferase [Fidelibacterota bacterium]
MVLEKSIWRVIDIIKWAESYFAEKGFSHPRREIEWLLQDLLHCQRMDIYLRFDEPLSQSQLSTLRSWIKRRLNREPLQYITGKTEFYGLPFHITPAVLIPRPETERLVDVAIHTLIGIPDPKILDIGTGTGCLALALAHEIKSSRVMATDISEDVLTLAERNRKELGLENVELIQSDILTEIPGEGFDAVICNPPYVPAIEMDSLMPDVQDFEPVTALTDGADGLTFYSRLAEIGSTLVRPGGWLLLEVGLGQHPERAKACFASSADFLTELIPDYNGDPRVLKVQVRQS